MMYIGGFSVMAEYRKESVEMIRIDSTAIEQVGYDFEAHTLVIRFHHRRSVNLFLDVPLEVWRDFMKAESKGKYFNTYIKGLFESETASL
jgi:hypothetical protein